MYNGAGQMALTFIVTLVVLCLLFEGNPIPVLRKMFSSKTFVFI